MKRPLGILLGAALTVVGAPPVGATSRAAIPTGGMKITALAKGDCATTPTSILITDATASCTIEITVTPRKRYADVNVMVPLSATSLYFPSWIENDGRVRLSAKGRGLVTVKKDRGGCVLVSGTLGVIAQVTNAKRYGGTYSAVAKSRPITVTYQQSTPAEGTCYATLQDS